MLPYYRFLSRFQVIDICGAIINIFHLIPAATTKLIEPLIQMVLKVENALLVNIIDSFFLMCRVYSLLAVVSVIVSYYLCRVLCCAVPCRAVLSCSVVSGRIGQGRRGQGRVVSCRVGSYRVLSCRVVVRCFIVALSCLLSHR